MEASEKESRYDGIPQFKDRLACCQNDAHRKIVALRRKSSLWMSPPSDNSTLSSHLPLSISPPSNAAGRVADTTTAKVSPGVNAPVTVATQVSPHVSPLPFFKPPEEDFWKHQRRISLFCPSHGETVEGCLTRRIKLLRDSVHDGEMFVLFEGGKDTMEDIDHKKIIKLSNAALALARVFGNAASCPKK